jgi:hypothetical protein
MKTRIFCAVLALGLAVVCMAQTSAPAPATPQAPTAAELRSTLSIVEQRLAFQENNLEKIQARMLDLDQSIEARIGQLLKQLESIKDTEGTRIANLKEDVMKSLKNSIDVYQRERNKRLAEVDRTYSTLSKEDLKGDAAKLQEKTEKRVDQILALAATLTKDAGYQKYDTYYTDNAVTRVKTDEYKQNRSESSKTDQATEDIVAGLRKSIDSLKQRNMEMERDLATANSTEKQQYLQDQIQSNEGLISKRQEQIQSTINASGGEGQGVSKQDAFQFDQLVDDLMLDLKRDFNELYRCATERDTARAKLWNLQVQQDAINVDLEAMTPVAPAK